MSLMSVREEFAKELITTFGMMPCFFQNIIKTCLMKKLSILIIAVIFITLNACKTETKEKTAATVIDVSSH